MFIMFIFNCTIMKIYFLFLSLGFALISFTCKKNLNGPYLPPHSLFFLIKKGGSRLPDSTLDNMKLYYYQNGIKTYLSDFGRATEEGYNLGILTTRDIGLRSGNDNIKIFYLEYLYGQPDTLFADYRHLSTNEAKQDPCYCYYPIQQVKFNGQVTSTDPSITQEPVYIFYKS